MDNAKRVILAQFAILFFLIVVRVSGVEQWKKIHDVLFAALVVLVPVYFYYVTELQHKRARVAILYGVVLTAGAAVGTFIRLYFGL